MCGSSQEQSTERYTRAKYMDPETRLNSVLHRTMSRIIGASVSIVKEEINLPSYVYRHVAIVFTEIS
jgi:hypothetical protein